MITPATPQTEASRWHTVQDAAPVVAYLMAYRYLWEGCPLWLVGLPGIPDPRRHPMAALEAARLAIEPPPTISIRSSVVA